MTKLKPSNIFDYYAPTGNSMKIANFGITKKTIPTTAVVTSNNLGTELRKSDNKDNTWLYILGGVTIIAGIICYVNYKKRQEEEKSKKQNHS